MMPGLPKNSQVTRASRGGIEAAISMSESRQLSVVKRRHMAVMVTTTFLLYSTISTIVFQVSQCPWKEETRLYVTGTCAAAASGGSVCLCDMLLWGYQIPLP